MDRDEEIYHMLGKVLANQESMNDRLEEHFSDDKIQFGHIRKRIASVENKMNYAAGAVAVVGTVIAVGWNIIAAKIKGYI
jgi:hypothetical protein